MTGRTLFVVAGRRVWDRRITAVAMALLCLAAAACSGEPGEDAGSGRISADGRGEASTAGVTALAGPEEGDGVAAADPADSTVAGGKATDSETPRGRTAGTAEGAPAVGAKQRPAVPPFAPGDERVGITDATIKLCTHINGQVASAIGSSQEDAKVFWRWLNDNGGIHGRKVDMTISDDGDGTTVAAAYEECRGSFLLIGGPTQEAIPPMREIVENDPHPMPYLHFMARSDPAKRYSFSWYPTQERNGVLTAQFILTRYPGKRIGVIRRDLPNWEPGFRAFVAELRRNGVEPVTAVAHPSREQVYEPYLADLAAKKAEVVWAWNHAIEHVPMLKQSRARGYGFQWVLGFPVGMVAETVREDLLAPRVTGVGVFTTFRAGLYDEHHTQYRQEGQLFEKAYEKYRGRKVDPLLGDFLFRQWLDGRQTVALLDKCGRACTRTKVVTVLVNDLSHFAPSCPFDFTLGRAAGSSVNAVEAYAVDGTVAWRETGHCVSRF